MSYAAEQQCGLP